VTESKARNTGDPRYDKLTIGVCPDQWGVWFPEDEKQIPWQTALDEMARAGFSVMETGPFGYFPKDPVRLKDEMDRRGFRVVAGTGWGILHQPEAWSETEATFRAIGETHAALGAEFVVHLPPLFRDDKTWEYTDDRVLSTEAWNLYISNADRLGRIMKEDYGLQMVLHPHGDSHIETPEDIDRIFQATDPEYVGFCLDTGHIVYGGGDPVELCRKYPERISYVHIKAMDPGLVKQAHDEDWPFGLAVAKGCSVAPPAGAPDMHGLIEALADLDKELYVVCEQDMYPCDPAYPLPNAIQTREYLASLGLVSPDDGGPAATTRTGAGAQPVGGAVEPRRTRAGGTTTSRASPSPSSRRAVTRPMAERPSRWTSWRTVVSETCSYAACSMSSKPTTETSSGTLRPWRRATSTKPIAHRSLKAATPVGRGPGRARNASAACAPSTSVSPPGSSTRTSPSLRIAAR
jgi:inosose dehydratase